MTSPEVQRLRELATAADKLRKDSDEWIPEGRIKVTVLLSDLITLISFYDEEARRADEMEAKLKEILRA